MELETKELFPPITVRGNGTSLWCTTEESNREFTLTSMSLRNCHDSDEPYELVLKGPDAQWIQYTDEGLAAAVNKTFLSIVQKLYPSYTVERFTWSEQGMQPQDGWSFDIFAKPR
jgi:hypothetical protein